jgi:sec-independent protein translocase protein TatB
MLDLGWTELLVIGVIALIVIGPKDLPMALHTFGKYVGKMRAMVREFQSGIDDIAKQHEMQELQKSVREIGSPKKAIENYVAELGADLNDVDNPAKKLKPAPEPVIAPETIAEEKPSAEEKPAVAAVAALDHSEELDVQAAAEAPDTASDSPKSSATAAS